MKYIRTKDKIITYEQGIEQAKKWFGTLFYNEEKGLEYLSQFKQADTIDELCDEFIWVNHKTNTRAFEGQPLEQVKDVYLKLDKTLWDFYGAIWSDKGLIYVAKMNDKGELELL